MSSVNIKSRLIGGSLWSLFGRGTKIVTAFVSVPLTLNYLGMERMGLWRLTLSMLAIVSLIQAGLVPHIKTRMTESFADGNLLQFKRYCSIGILLSVAILILGLLVALSAQFVNWASLMNVNDPIAQRETLPLVTVLLICSFAQISTSFIPAIFEARLSLSKPKIIELIASLLSFGMLLVGIWLKVGLPLLAGVVSVPIIILRIGMLKEIKAEFPDVFQPKLRDVSPILKELARPAIFSIGIQLNTVLIGAAPSFIIARTLSLADVTLFSICYQFITIPLIVLSAVVPVFWPAFTSLWRVGKKAELKKMFLMVCGVTFLVFSGYALCSGVIGPWLIKLWVGGEIAPTRSFLLLIGLFVIGKGLHCWLSTLLWSLKELRTLFLAELMQAVIVIVAGYFLVLRMGLSGIVLSMSIALYVGALFLMFNRVLKIFKAR